MNQAAVSQVKHLTLPGKDSHKGENGRLTIIGGSKLFHGASLWALQVSSRIVDMVYYSSVKENQALTEYLKSSLYSFIFIPQGKESEYITSSDAVLIGPGMVRGSTEYTGTGESGEETRELTITLLQAFPKKKWIIDAGALQALTGNDFNQLNLYSAIITPHEQEFKRVFGIDVSELDIHKRQEVVVKTAMEKNLTIVLKGKTDIISDGKETVLNTTGNEGMTKGGTGDVLAGLIAALACKNPLFIAAAVGTYINGLAGDRLYEKVGPYFNADDVARIVPQVLWDQIHKKAV